MNLLTLIGLSAVFTFLPAMSETTGVFYVHTLHWSPLAVAACCAAGQCIAYAALFLFGEQLVTRWAWLARQTTRVRTRYAHHLENRFLAVSFFGGTISVPPAVALSALAPGFGVPLKHLLPLLYVTRVLRFVVLIYFGDQLTSGVLSLV